MRRIRLHRRALAAVAALAVVAGLSTACAPDGQVAFEAPEQAEGSLPAETTAQLEAAVQAAMTATASPGAIVGVWSPWSGSWVTTIGTDADGGALDVDMGFRAGDLTRLMTCDVLYSVVAEGEVSLDDPVSEYVAGVPDLADVTLEQLCDGTSGLGSSQPALRSTWVNNPERQWTPLELAAFGLGRDRLSPGSTYRDSDAGYLMLGMALERATGSSFSTLLEERVFAPLGMEDSSLPGARAAEPTASGGVLPGYTLGRNDEGVLGCANFVDISTLSASIGYSDSGVVSTVPDLGRYLRGLAAGALDAGDASADRWADPLPASSKAPAWFTTAGGAFQAGTLIGQYSWMPGYLTAGYVDPETGMTVVVVLDNSRGSASTVNALAWQLAAIASKAPASSGFTAPEFGLPWTAEQYGATVANGAVDCS